jgi:1-acyl-sn-glycerol-3-phosphate acyltransferase
MLIRIGHLERKGETGKRDKLADKFSMKLAKGLFRLTGSSLEITGMENVPCDRPVLFVSNHQSHMDSAVIHGFINVPKGFIVDKDANNIPIIRKWLKYMKCVPVDRKNAVKNIHSMEKAIEYLREGHSMVIYPEGRLDEGKCLMKFRTGCVRLAMKAKVSIVPVTVIDTWRVMNRNATKISSAKIRCIISPAVDISGFKKSDEKAIITQLYNIIERNLKYEIS